MYCKNCGNEISENDIFCKNCGKKINEDKNESNDNKELPMNWYNFLVYFRYPLGFMTGIYNLFSVYPSLFASDKLFASILFFAFIFDIFSVIFMIVPFYLLLTKKKTAITMFFVYEIFALFVNSFSISLKYISTGISYVIAFFVADIAIMCFIWLYPNYLYFKKREKYFIN